MIFKKYCIKRRIKCLFLLCNSILLIACKMINLLLLTFAVGNNRCTDRNDRVNI